MAQIAEMLKLSNTLPPMGNTLVSNVPGPKEHLYLKGALMEEMHPISTLPPSNLLNITLFSYAGDLFFGLIATDELPHLQRLGDYVQEAFTELEDSVRDAHAAVSVQLALGTAQGAVHGGDPGRPPSGDQRAEIVLVLFQVLHCPGTLRRRGAVMQVRKHCAVFPEQWCRCRRARLEPAMSPCAPAAP